MCAGLLVLGRVVAHGFVSVESARIFAALMDGHYNPS